MVRWEYFGGRRSKATRALVASDAAAAFSYRRLLYSYLLARARSLTQRWRKSLSGDQGYRCEGITYRGEVIMFDNSTSEKAGQSAAQPSGAQPSQAKAIMA